MSRFFETPTYILSMKSNNIFISTSILNQVQHQQSFMNILYTKALCYMMEQKGIINLSLLNFPHERKP